jgi:hypothetical protein
MENNQEQLILSKEEREKLIQKIDVLEKVKSLILLGGTEMATIEQIAEYYEVTKRQIERILESNRDELKEDGYRVFKAKDFNTDIIGGIKNIKTAKGKFIINFENNSSEEFSPRGVALFTKRAILRVGMLLCNSKIARKIRTTLLDIEDQTSVVTKENIINNERDLLLNIIDSSDNPLQLALAMGEYKKYKDRHIKALETERDVLVGQVMNWDYQAIINKLIRKIAGKIFNGNYAKAWEKLWADLLYKHEIGIRSRITKSKKEGATTFDVLYPAEIQKALECSIALCEMYRIDISDVMIHNNNIKAIEV